MKKILNVSILVFLLVAFMPRFVSGLGTPPPDSTKTIVVAGSSVAAGWVTSYEEKYDMQNGYVARLARELAPAGWKVTNKSRPGFTTSDVLASWSQYTDPRPDYLFIGLSMANEGLSSQNTDTVFNRFRRGLKEIISRCNRDGIKPVVGLCYANNDYSDTHHDCIRRMNATINSWSVPCVNFLGPLNNGHGQFPEGLTFDAGHPDNRGHEELFLAIPPSMFDAMESGRKLPDMKSFQSPAAITPKPLKGNLMVVPSDVIHSFSFSFFVSSLHPSRLATIEHEQGAFTLLVNPEGKAELVKNDTVVFEFKGFDLKKQHHFLINQNYVNQQVEWWLDGKPAYTLHQQIEPVCFAVNTSEKGLGICNVLLYRASLHPDEIKAVLSGVPPQASLEYAAMSPKAEGESKLLANMALSEVEATLDAASKEKKIRTLKQKIEAARKARQSELFFPPKIPIEATPERWGKFAGKYQIAENDFFEITLEQSKLYMEDRGNKAQLLPESASKFFIHYPADLTVEFVENAEGGVLELIFSMNGREMRAKKVP